jgi:hypothetical protein
VQFNYLTTSLHICALKYSTFCIFSVSKIALGWLMILGI